MTVDKSINNILYRWGFGLSGGAYRGVGQVGVLKAMEERGIKPDVISGTSSGALNAVLYAQGYSPDEMYEIWMKEPFGKVLNFHLPRFGFLKNSRIGELVKPYLRYHRLEDLPVKVFLSAACLNDGSQRIFEEGDLMLLLSACCAVPVVFEPVEIDGRQYVDGGLVSNLPIEPLVGKCETIIGISVNPIPDKERLDGLKDIIYRTIWVGLEGTVRKNMQLCDWFIAPQEIGEHGFMERSALELFFKSGYEYTKRFLQEKGIQKISV